MTKDPERYVASVQFLFLSVLSILHLCNFRFELTELTYREFLSHCERRTHGPPFVRFGFFSSHPNFVPFHIYVVNAKELRD